MPLRIQRDGVKAANHLHEFLSVEMRFFSRLAGVYENRRIYYPLLASQMTRLS